jgi:outer membrane protein OmpA-like peptidoglycan-associated protein
MRVGTLLVAAALAGCAADDPNRRAKTGAAVGAVAGAVLGHQVSHRSGAVVGAAVGALAGAGVGHYMDRQEQEMNAALAEEQRRHELEVQRLQDDSLKIDMTSEVSFDFGSAALKPAFLPTLDKVADIIGRYDQTAVHIIGHTDSIGSDDYNLDLSHRRAESVAVYLERRGVDGRRLRTEGRGEREPRATNQTEAGRQLNRRVEMVLRPIVEGRESDAYEAPPTAPAY